MAEKHTEFTPEKLYKMRTKNRNRTMLISFILIVLCYIFFFMSPVIFKTPSESEYTPIGEKEFLTDGREIIIESWKYSPKQALMEVLIDIENEAVDGKDFYDYTAFVNFLEASKGKEQLAVEIKLQQINYVVLWLHDVPEDFNSCAVTVHMKGKSDDSATLFTNKDKVENVNKLTVKSKTEYQIEKISRNIAKLQRKISDNNKEINKLKKEIKTINSHITEEHNNLIYKTLREQEKVKAVIEEYREQISDREYQIGNLQKDNKACNSKITEYNNLIGKLKEKK